MRTYTHTYDTPNNIRHAHMTHVATVTHLSTFLQLTHPSAAEAKKAAEQEALSTLQAEMAKKEAELEAKLAKMQTEVRQVLCVVQCVM